MPPWPRVEGPIRTYRKQPVRGIGGAVWVRQDIAVMWAYGEEARAERRGNEGDPLEGSAGRFQQCKKAGTVAPHDCFDPTVVDTSDLDDENQYYGGFFLSRRWCYIIPSTAGK